MSQARRTTRDTEGLLEDLARGDDTPRQIAQKHGMTLAQLTKWASRPTTARRVNEARRLADERATLAVSSARVAAAHALRRLALGTDHPETARRACIDLLKLDPRSLDDEPPKQHETADLSTESKNTIRALLEHLEARQGEDTNS